MKNALVFGVCEEMGKHLCQALIEQHWEVMGVIKENETNAPVLGNLTLVELTHTDLDFLYDLVEDVDAIFIHQPETDTNQRDNLIFPLEQIIQLAEFFNLQLIITTNKYHIKQNQLPSFAFWHQKKPIKIALPHKLHNRLYHASQSGVRVLVMGCGHTLGFTRRKCYLGMLVKETEHQLLLQSPSEKAMKHHWTYLPDLAKNLVHIVTHQQHEFNTFDTLYYSGHTASINDIARCLALSSGKPVIVTPLHWTIMEFIALFSPLFRGFLKARTLWQQGGMCPHNTFPQINNSEITHTPLELALQKCWEQRH